jgi:DNA-binding winged helix-turn-helix (wHTH) protein
VSDKIIDVYISRLRAIFRDAGLRSDFIETVHGFGFRMPKAFGAADPARQPAELSLVQAGA